MRVRVNGREREVPEGATVADLIDSLGLNPRRIAVERNRRLVRRATFAQTALTPEDHVEIVTLVGGGRSGKARRGESEKTGKRENGRMGIEVWEWSIETL